MQVEPAENAEIEDTKMKDQEEAKDNEDDKDGHELTTKKYGDEDNYKMISLVLRYPSGGHGGETFWMWMLKIYGDTLLEGRNANSLRNRWRILSKKHPNNLDEYKKELAEKIPKEVIDNIEKIIAEATNNISNYDLSNKAYALLFPGIPRPLDCKDGERGKRKRAEGSNFEGGLGDDKRKFIKLNTRNHVDLNKLSSSTPNTALNLVDDIDSSSLQAKLLFVENFMIIRNLIDNTISIKDRKDLPLTEEIAMFKKVEAKPRNYFKTINQCIIKSNEVHEWTELEDMVLKTSNNPDMLKLLVSSKGFENVERRKKLIGIS